MTSDLILLRWNFYDCPDSGFYFRHMLLFFAQMQTNTDCSSPWFEVAPHCWSWSPMYDPIHITDNHQKWDHQMTHTKTRRIQGFWGFWDATQKPDLCTRKGVFLTFGALALATKFLSWIIYRNPNWQPNLDSLAPKMMALSLWTPLDLMATNRCFGFIFSHLPVHAQKNMVDIHGFALPPKSSDSWSISSVSGWWKIHILDMYRNHSAKSLVPQKLRRVLFGANFFFF